MKTSPLDVNNTSTILMCLGESIELGRLLVPSAASRCGGGSEYAMAKAAEQAVEKRWIRYVDQHRGESAADELVALLPGCSWAQVGVGTLGVSLRRSQGDANRWPK